MADTQIYLGGASGHGAVIVFEKRPGPRRNCWPSSAGPGPAGRTYFDFETLRRKGGRRPPFTKVSLLDREIFGQHHSGRNWMLRDFRMPNRSWEGCDVDDPSARVLSNYGQSGM